MKYGLMILLTLVVGITHAQEVVTIDADDLNDTYRFAGTSWRFQAGDSLQWARADHDDTHWGTVGSLPYMSDSLYSAGWVGIGWFRVTFHVTDTTVRHLLVNVAGYGVTELFLDGERVLSSVRMPESVTADSELTLGLIDESTLISVHPDSAHTLAIRYANPYPSRLVTNTMRYLPKDFRRESAPGIRVTFAAPSAHRSILYAQKSLWAVLGLMTGVVGILAVLGMVIRAQGVGDKALLYLVLALVGVTGFLGIQWYQGLNLGALWTLPWLMHVMAIGLKGSFLLVGLGMSAAFFPGRRLVPSMLAVLLVLVLVGDYSMERSPLHTTLFYVMNTVFQGVVGAIAVAAMWKRKPGAWTLGAGLLLSAATIVIISLTQNNNIYWQIFAILLLPVSVGALIVRRYSESTKAKLAAEQDRQRLIETQKERLEEEVAERTLELRQSMDRLHETQEQLIQSEKLASLGSLTAGIAHEIKNPLNFVNNFAEVGAEMADELAEAIAAGRTEEAQSIVDELKANALQITKHGRRADDIVRAMMQHARGGAAEREVVDVNVFLEEYANLAWHGMRAKDHDFQAELDRAFDPDAGSLVVVPQDLGRVILNLLNNAFDAVRDAPEARVTISSKRGPDGVTITVADNGPGIPEDIRQKIFEPFFTTKPTGEGTGLGLSLSYDIVTKGHGGTMTVGSSASGGALFTISLPVTP
jgi:signal transduction histidine kinase